MTTPLWRRFRERPTASCGSCSWSSNWFTGPASSRAGRSCVHGRRRARSTLDSLLAFHDQAIQAGDDSATEWARRQLESYRAKTINPDDQTRIDLACDRPDRLNERLVARYVEVLRDSDAEAREQFVAEAIGTGTPAPVRRRFFWRGKRLRVRRPAGSVS